MNKKTKILYGGALFFAALAVTKKGQKKPPSKIIYADVTKPASEGPTMSDGTKPTPLNL